MQPTARSENAKLEINALEGECSELHLRRAPIIKLLPKIAVTDITMFTTKMMKYTAPELLAMMLYCSSKFWQIVVKFVIFCR